jgi:hypothetical protein
MIKVLKEKTVEVKEKYYSKEDLKKERWVCKHSGGCKYILVHEALSSSRNISNYDAGIRILTHENIDDSFASGTQHQFIVFETRREMLLWFAED